MNTHRGFRQWAPALGAAFLAAATSATAAVTLEGQVALDYYVADVDDEGFEYVDAAFYAERIENDGTRRSGPLSLAGWATTTASPAGAGVELGTLPIGSLGAGSSLHDVDGIAPAEDAPPGEYYTHLLLQDGNYPGSWEDARSLTPTLLWRGGLEAVGPLNVSRVYGHTVEVDFAELRNNRLDHALTHDIELTLYATYGYGPASEGYTLCRVVVPGLYAGDYRPAERFTCFANSVPDGEYTLHLDVAEIGGRGGYSTLSGPDVYFRGGTLDGGFVDAVYVTGASGPVLLLPLLAVVLLRRRRGAAVVGAAQARRCSA